MCNLISAKKRAQRSVWKSRRKLLSILYQYSTYCIHCQTRVKMIDEDGCDGDHDSLINWV